MANMRRVCETPETYVMQLMSELAQLETTYVEVLAASEIRDVDPNRYPGDTPFIGAQKWGWGTSDDALTVQRMDLLAQLHSLEPRFRLLFQHQIPEVAKRLDSDFDQLEKWLDRGKRDHSVPPTTEAAQAVLDRTFDDLRSLLDLLPSDEWKVRLVVDTNALVDNPDLAIYQPHLGARYLVHLLPVVLRELDDHKRGGRTPELREAAKRADRRLKGLRTNGDVRSGVRVAGDVFVVFEHVEPRSEGLPSWLDLDVPDDRFVASTLLLQSQHPGSAFYVATSDINLQTKLAAVGLPFLEPPPP